MQLIIQLPPRSEQLEINRARWNEVLADRRLTELPFRIETNALGQILMSPPPSVGHSNRQGRITILLDRLLGGVSLPECPISTLDGVKAADVGWYSLERFSKVDGQSACEIAPEICVEVLSPCNTHSEMQNKRSLYFEAGAEEVWICDLDGSFLFYCASDQEQPKTQSTICTDFPASI